MVFIEVVRSKLRRTNPKIASQRSDCLYLDHPRLFDRPLNKLTDWDPVVDEKLWSASDVGQHRAAGINADIMVQRGKDVAETIGAYGAASLVKYTNSVNPCNQNVLLDELEKR